MVVPILQIGYYITNILIVRSTDMVVIYQFQHIKDWFLIANVRNLSQSSFAAATPVIPILLCLSFDHLTIKTSKPPWIPQKWSNWKVLIDQHQIRFYTAFFYKLFEIEFSKNKWLKKLCKTFNRKYLFSLQNIFLILKISQYVRTRKWANLIPWYSRKN